MAIPSNGLIRIVAMHVGDVVFDHGSARQSFELYWKLVHEFRDDLAHSDRALALSLSGGELAADLHEAERPEDERVPQTGGVFKVKRRRAVEFRTGDRAWEEFDLVAEGDLGDREAVGRADGDQPHRRCGRP